LAFGHVQPASPILATSQCESTLFKNSDSHALTLYVDAARPRTSCDKAPHLGLAGYAVVPPSSKRLRPTVAAAPGIGQARNTVAFPPFIRKKTRYLNEPDGNRVGLEQNIDEASWCLTSA